MDIPETRTQRVARLLRREHREEDALPPPPDLYVRQSEVASVVRAAIKAEQDLAIAHEVKAALADLTGIANDNFDTVQTDLTSLQGQIHDLSENVKGLREDIDGLRSDLDELRSDIEARQ